MKVSIIMPVYNAEKHIEKSIDSVLKQSYQDIELILVNDGSTDKSKIICEQYEKIDTRVTLINIKNSGPGFTRNKGIYGSVGEYISFVDADDSLKANAIETLLNIALEKDYDVVSSNHFRVKREIRVSKNHYQTGEIDKYGTENEKKRYNSFKTSSSFGYVWAKVYKRSFLIKNNIVFSEEKKVFLEDTFFNLKILAHHPKYFVLNQPLYYYNILDESLSNKTEDITQRAKGVLKNYEQFLDQTNLYEENIDLFISLATRTISWSLFKSMDCNFSFRNINNKVSEFSNDSTIKRLFFNRNSLSELRGIDSSLQVLLYSFIVICFRYKLNFIISLVFYICYPLFKTYIWRFLKS